MAMTVLSVLPTLTSCGDTFRVTDDDKSIVDEKFFADESSYLSALTNAYTQLRSPWLYGSALTLGMMEYAAQDMMPAEDDAQAKAAARLDFKSPILRQTADSTARAAYRLVASCNQLIKAGGRSDVHWTIDGQKEVIIGEAYALRAAVMLDMARLYHPVPKDGASEGYIGLPYPTEAGQRTLTPLTTQALLDQVAADLGRAEQLLDGHDPILQATNPTSVTLGQIDRRLRTFHLNYYAVKALQARLALWRGDYATALAAADAVFDHQRKVAQRYQLFYFVAPGKYGSDFCFSRESVFGVATLPGGFSALSDSLYLRRQVRATATLSTRYAQTTDIRYRAWFNRSADGKGYVMSGKYGSQTLLSDYVPSTTGSQSQLPASIPFVRLGEVALTAAEALNESGQTDEALQRLEEMEGYKNVDYARQWATAADKGLSAQDRQEAVRQLIREEYCRDLFGDGQLFYHYKRWGLTTLSQADGTTRQVDAADYTWPLPALLLSAE